MTRVNNTLFLLLLLLFSQQNNIFHTFVYQFSVALVPKTYHEMALKNMAMELAAVIIVGFLFRVVGAFFELCLV